MKKIQKWKRNEENTEDTKKLNPSVLLQSKKEMGQSRNLWNVRKSAQIMWFNEYRIGIDNLVKDERKIKESWQVFEENLPMLPGFNQFWAVCKEKFISLTTTPNPIIPKPNVHQLNE